MSLVVLVVDWVAVRPRTGQAAAHLLGRLQQGMQLPDTCLYARLAGRRIHMDLEDRFRVHRTLVHRHRRMVYLRVLHTEVATKHPTLVQPAYIQPVLL